MQNKEPEFNWKLLLFSVFGFTAGAAVVSFLVNVIGFTIGYVIGFAIVGALGGATIGLALKDKTKVFYLSGMVAIGFGIGGIGMGAIEFIDQNVMGVTLGFAFIGAIGSAALGLALKDKTEVPYLSVMGAIGFALGGFVNFTMGAMGFAIKGTIGGAVNFPITGAIMGTTLGLSLAYLTKKNKRR